MNPLNIALLVILFEPIIVVHGFLRRIQGGQTAGDKQFPYYVALFRHGSFGCGGSIIDTRWILTAAHCVISPEGITIEPEELDILAGTEYLHRGGLYLEPEKVFPHESHTFGGYEYDVALIRLKDEIVYGENVQKIELSREELPAGKQVIVIGYGSDHYGHIKPNFERLVFNRMLTIPNESCDAKGALCVNNVAAYGICDGDSGGPAVHDYKQVAVVHFVNTRCGSEVPDSFAKVAFNYEWIMKTMKK